VIVAAEVAARSDDRWRNSLLHLLLVADLEGDLDQLGLTLVAVSEDFTIDISVGVDSVASSTEAERWLQALTGLEGLQPRLEVSWRFDDVDPSLPDVLDRQHVVVVVCDRLEPDELGPRGGVTGSRRRSPQPVAS